MKRNGVTRNAIVYRPYVLPLSTTSSSKTEILDALKERASGYSCTKISGTGKTVALQASFG
jgi:hypothetical protein